jgi:glutamyl-Q tRNA(Asp) synthetase
MPEHSVDSANYIGRFAPSPTGPLHFGSLFAAIASYADAKANAGKWLLRMEDLDPPREPQGAAEQILQQLLDFGLEWDGEVLYQSFRLEQYDSAIAALTEKNLCFYCDCTRPQVKAMGSVYNGHCRDRSLAAGNDVALRVKTEATDIGFQDSVCGYYSQNIRQDVGDFIVRRKDGLHAYQLAVVVDDEFQNITHVVRGVDLLDSTPRQIYLQRKLGYSTPTYCHLPILVNEQGQKLSKQHFAAPIQKENASELTFRSLSLLGQDPPESLRTEQVNRQLEWAIEHWRIQAVPKLANIPL